MIYDIWKRKLELMDVRNKTITKQYSKNKMYFLLKNINNLKIAIKFTLL